jgi:16S rRNA (adenine1518-N6/adenine1519-N6)-dimethyltransferase
MLQREVAERISARPGDMSYLSVFVQYHSAVRVAFTVPREAFEPAPEVDSAVVVIEPIDPMGDRPRLPAAEEAELWQLVQAGFRERRKMIRKVLVRQMPPLGERIDAALEACSITADRRPQTLGVDEWLALRSALTPLPGLKAATPAPAGRHSGGARKGRR